MLISGVAVGYENEKVEAPDTNIPKPKKFFKSRNSDQSDNPPTIHTGKADSYGSNKRVKNSSPEKQTSSKVSTSRKFFTSKNSSTEKTVLSSNVNNNVKRDESKPPIVLRICRGKSQLLSDSDESESTPTPSSTPSTSAITSPRATKDTSITTTASTTPQRKPGNIRITRSARRSMQQDPGSSPATADTPGETFSALFTSPKKDVDLCPEYIPAEEYELERKALYDSLLKPNSPKESATSTENIDPFNCNPDTLNEEPATTFAKSEEADNSDEVSIKSPSEEVCLEEVKETITIEGDKETEDTPLETVAEPMDISLSPKDEDKDYQKIDDPIISNQDSDEVEANFFENPLKKPKIDDYSTDSDSDSSVPNIIRRRSPRNKDKTKNFPIEKHKEEILDKILDLPAEPLAPVKLVISKKKGSIFKSRSMVTDATKKRRALYKHKWSGSDENKDSNQKNMGDGKDGTSIYNDFEFNDDPLTRVTTGYDSDTSSEITGVKCTKSDKGVRCIFFSLI